MGQDASTFVKNVDDAFLFVAAASLVVLIGIVIFMIYFVVRYSRKRNPVPTDIPGNTFLEVLWTAIPTVLFLGMFYFGWVGYEQMRNIPKNAIGLKVIARMWQWQFAYPNGVQADTLYVPVNKPIKLEITSMDVNHSFFVPAFRIKRDAIPNMRNTMWFDATKKGSFDVECAEYCGLKHSLMLTKVVVMDSSAFDAWYRDVSKAQAKPYASLFVAPAVETGAPSESQ